MRRYLICHDSSSALFGPYVSIEFVNALKVEGELFSEDEARRLYPDAVLRWEARDDTIAERTRALVSEIDSLIEKPHE